ncbi:MAG: ParA family protein [Burkholderiaceae bacterium]|nr:ParA family protein [Burkholderiaceae bacterium]
MPVIAVVNPKGGVGKTTLATNLAGYFASQDERTMLGDFDRQQSARQWLSLRPAGVKPIDTWEMNGEIARPPRGVTHVVLDTPAQITGKRLSEVARVADRIVVPVQPSMFDVMATQHFLGELEAVLGNARRFREIVSIVGMRVDPRTRAAEQLARFVGSVGLPVSGYLRDTQNYVHLAAHGLTVFDIPSQRIDKDRVTWEPLLQWLGR